MTIELYLGEAVEVIDRTFGNGYAAQHPELVGAFIQAASSDYAARKMMTRSRAWSVKETTHRSNRYGYDQSGHFKAGLQIRSYPHCCGTIGSPDDGWPVAHWSLPATPRPRVRILGGRFASVIEPTGGAWGDRTVPI